MAEFFNDITQVPEQIVIYGDGLRDMELSHFKTLVRALGSMGLAVGGIDSLHSEGIKNPEEEPQDIPLYKSDFMRVAKDNDLDKSVATKTWNCLTRDWRYFTEAKQKKEIGIELSDFDKKKLISLPKWRQDLCLSEGEVSFGKLKVAVESELLIHIDGIGPTNLSLIQKIVADTEEKSIDPQI